MSDRRTSLRRTWSALLLGLISVGFVGVAPALAAGNSYEQIATLMPSHGVGELGVNNGNDAIYAPRNTFGTAVGVSADGDVVAVGDPNDGSVLVYTKSASDDWKRATQTVRLRSDTVGSSSGLGQSVAVSADGKTIVAGEVDVPNSSGSPIGRAVIYTEPSKGWAHSNGEPTTVLFSTSPTSIDHFGGSVAVDADGGTIVVGAPGYNGVEGAVYIYQRPKSGWPDSAQGPDGIAAAPFAINEPGAGGGLGGGAFGGAVALSGGGHTLAVGAPWQNGFEGAAYLYALSGYTLTALKTLPDTASGTANHSYGCAPVIDNPELGMAVSLASNAKTLAVGEACAGSGGQVLVYRRPAAGWSASGGNPSDFLAPLRPDITAIQRFGNDVAISGSGNRIAADDPLFQGQGAFGEVFTKPSHGWVLGPQVDLSDFSALFGNTQDAGNQPTSDIPGFPLAINDDGRYVFMGASVPANHGEVDVFELASDVPSSTFVSCSPQLLKATGDQTTCTVSVGSKSSTPTGKVSFHVQGNSSYYHLSASSCTLHQLSNGLASCKVKFTPEKALSFPLTADYGGDNSHGPGHSSTLVTTLLVATSAQLSCSPEPVQAGDQVNCSAVLTGAAVSPNAQKAQFKLLTSPIEGLPLASPACSFTAPTAADDQWSETCTTSYSALSVGNYELEAIYPDDVHDAGSYATATVAGVAHATSTQVTCLPGTNSVTCTAIVTDDSSVPGNPTGTVNFAAVPSGSLGTATQASCSLTATSGSSTQSTCAANYAAVRGANYTVTATYVGDVVNQTSSNVTHIFAG